MRPRENLRIGLLCALVGVSAISCYLLGAAVGGRRSAELADQLRGVSAPRRPHADLTPSDVVKIQLDALAGEGGDMAGVTQCFAFASPLNREATGPLDRFAAMIATPPYDVLLTPEETSVGDARIPGDQAYVLVSLVDRHQQLHVFGFLLSRQANAEYAGCWMTDAVFQLAAARNEPGGAPPELDLAI